MTSKEGAVLSITINADAKLTIQENGNQTARYYLIADADGKEVAKHYMSKTAETIDLKAGTYTLTTCGGEMKTILMELTVA